MTETVLEPQPVPLQRDSEGVWRVAGTRVPLERVIASVKKIDGVYDVTRSSRTVNTAR